MLNKTYRYLEISVLYLSDRYHGKGTWPPSPARLFQALVAAGRKGLSLEEWQDSTAPSLEWLERKEAPTIFAPDANRRGYHVTSVPRNQAERAVKSTGIDGAYLRKHKDLKPFRPFLLSDDLRERFIHYLWPVSEEEVKKHRNEFEKIRWIARRMSHLGLGIDQVAGNSYLVCGDEVAYEGCKLYEPTHLPSALRFEVPAPGYLGNLIDLYETKRDRFKAGVVSTYFHPERYRLSAYRKEGELDLSRPIAVFALKSPEGTGRNLSVRWQDAAMTVAPWARHGAGIIAKKEECPQEWTDQFVSGHTSGNTRDQRLSYLPLPTIGHRNADGRIRRFAIAEPLGSDGKTMEMIEWGLPYIELINIDGEKVAKAETIGSLTDSVVKRYCGKSKAWTTVTPMIMHGQVYQRGKFSPRKLEKLLLSAFSDAGYPEDVVHDFDFKRAPYWAGCGDARLMRVPRHLNKWPRYHVSVEFKTEISGPIIAGIGRHYGLGLFARV